MVIKEQIDIPEQLEALHEIGWSWLAMAEELRVTKDTLRAWRRGTEPTMPFIVSRALSTLEGLEPPGHYRKTSGWWMERLQPSA